MKPLASMNEAEKNALLNPITKIPEYTQEDIDLFESIEEKLKTQPPLYQDASKDKLHFLSSMDKPPKRSILGVFSKDDPKDLSKYPPVKKVHIEPNYDINEPGAAIKPQKRRGLLKEMGVAIAWVFHVLTVVGSIGFTYYIVTLLRAGITTINDLSLLTVIISIQISLVAVEVLLGSVVRR